MFHISTTAMLDAYWKAGHVTNLLVQVHQIETSTNDSVVRFGLNIDNEKYIGNSVPHLSARQQRTLQYSLSLLLGRHKEAVDELNALKRNSVNEGIAPSEFDAFLSTLDVEGEAVNVRDPYKRNRHLKGLARFKCDFTDHLDIDSMFTAEECYGECFDLSSHYQTYRNIGGSVDCTYYDYLKVFASFDSPAYSAITDFKLFGAYLSSLRDYLKAYQTRSCPLRKVTDFFAETLQDPEAMPQDELYCEPCQKRFSSKGVFSSHLSGRKHQNALQGVTSNPSAKRSIENLKLEIDYLLEAQADVLHNTTESAVRRSVMTELERQRDLELIRQQQAAEDEQITDEETQEFEEVADESEEEYDGEHEQEDEESESFQNYGTDQEETEIGGSSKADGELENDGGDEHQAESESGGLVGPDGQPIPRWLYNLRGYSETFQCEICANQTFMGRRLFQKHFNEAKHINGLLALGITSKLRIFQGVHLLQDVQRIAAELEAQSSSTLQELEPQAEDTEGNVMSQKIYDELRRQGLM